MIPKVYNQKIKLTDGREIELETGKLAKLADGSVVVKMGNCMLLATVVSSRQPSPVDFLPLTVDYREKFASAGRFPGGFFKREARPSTEEILTMRLVDRVLRPLFPKDYHYETQVMLQLMSHDENIMPDSLAGLAASTAIQLSDIPFEYPISEVRVGRINGEFIINPSKTELSESDIDIMIGASEDSIAMVEGEFNEISEQEMLEAIKYGHEAIKTQIDAQKKLVKQLGGKRNFREYEQEVNDKKLEESIFNSAYKDCFEIAKKGLSKHDRSEQFKALKESIEEKFNNDDDENNVLVSKYFSNTQKNAIRDLVLDKGIRLDGRKSDDIRDIWCEIDYLPSTHGSAIFSRGETQALATVTLGTSKEANVIDLPTEQSEENFYLHYNFPPFSTGEARPLRGTSRREIGHGNLAQRALKKVIPSNCPYTVRVVSEVLESNGSSSMATVCSATMALMDAGIQINKPVSGIAMGLISKEGNYAILSDILGDEDHLGDMDFKVTGTADGITACQMDIKIKGLGYDILSKALEQARVGRLSILDKILETIPKTSKDVKNHAPKMIKLSIPGDYIGAVIGPGGKVIQELQKETETTIVIEEKDEKGEIEILGVNKEKIEFAIEKIKQITFEPKVGETYNVKVVKLLDFGAVVEFFPGKEVLLHISELAWERVNSVNDVLKINDLIDVKYFGIDPRTKKQKVSRKALLPRPEKREDKN